MIGGITYLHVGGTENGTTLYLFNPAETTGRVLLHADPSPTSAAASFPGTTATGTASVGGTTYLLGGGATDDGVSTFGSSTTGQLWYSTEGNLADARIAFVNTDGGNHVTFIDNNPATELTTGFLESVALDTAAGLYYILVTGNEGINAKILMGHIGSADAADRRLHLRPDLCRQREQSRLRPRDRYDQRAALCRLYRVQPDLRPDHPGHPPVQLQHHHRRGDGGHVLRHREFNARRRTAERGGSRRPVRQPGPRHRYHAQRALQPAACPGQRLRNQQHPALQPVGPGRRHGCLSTRPCSRSTATAATSPR